MPNPNDPALTPEKPIDAPDQCPDSTKESVSKLTLAVRVRDQIAVAADKDGITVDELCRRACMSHEEMERMVEKSILEQDEKDKETIAQLQQQKAESIPTLKDLCVCRIKGIRKALDEQLQVIRDPMFRDDILASAGRCHADAFTAINEAEVNLKQTIMWLGMTMKALNDGVSCYKEGYNPESPVVEPIPDGLKM